MIKRIALLPAMLVTAFSGCLIESGNAKCDDNQRFLDGFCVCVDGAVPAADDVGCTRCGENQVAVNNACECADGFVKTTTGTCVKAPEGLGAPCDPDANTCPDDFPLCHQGRFGAPVCTRDCSEESTCDQPFGCTLSDGASVCLPPPTGLYDPCESDADCPGDASYCGVTGFCLEWDCDAETPCWGGSVCCDYRSFDAPTVCVPAEGLENGACYLDVPQIEPNGGVAQ